MVGVYLLKPKDGMIYKYLNHDNSVGVLLYKRLRKKKYYGIFKRIIEQSHILPWLGKHIVRGECIRPVGSYRSPWVNGFTLAKIPYPKLTVAQLIQLSCAISVFIGNLTKYLKRRSLTGDWALHNVMYDGRQLINIDLEGFFTYSSVGPALPWNPTENTPGFIMRALRSLQRRLVAKLVHRPVSSLEYLTIIHCPPGYPIICPGKLWDTTPLVSGIITSELYLTPPTTIARNLRYYCYLGCHGGNLRCLLTTSPLPPSNNQDNWHHWFSFYAAVPQRSELRYYFTVVSNPTRIKLSDNNTPGGLVVGHFHPPSTKVIPENKIVITQ